MFTISMRLNPYSIETVECHDSMGVIESDGILKFHYNTKQQAEKLFNQSRKFFNVSEPVIHTLEEYKEYCNKLSAYSSNVIRHYLYVVDKWYYSDNSGNNFREVEMSYPIHYLMRNLYTS